MAWLHENKEIFSIVVNLAANKYSISSVVVEKDYYVTMILRGLASRLDYAMYNKSISKIFEYVLL